jgi:hypothetical protein
VNSSLLEIPGSKTHGEAPILVAMADQLRRFVLSFIRYVMSEGAVAGRVKEIPPVDAFSGLYEGNLLVPELSSLNVPGVSPRA